MGPMKSHKTAPTVVLLKLNFSTCKLIIKAFYLGIQNETKFPLKITFKSIFSDNWKWLQFYLKKSAKGVSIGLSKTSSWVTAWATSPRVGWPTLRGSACSSTRSTSSSIT